MGFLSKVKGVIASMRQADQGTKVAAGTPSPRRVGLDLRNLPVQPEAVEGGRYVWLEVQWAHLFGGKMKYWVLWDETEQRILSDAEETRITGI